MDRALPGWAVDVIRDGVRPADLRASGDRAVWRALVRTATSAHQRGMDRCEWDAMLADPRSRLGAQARVQHGKPRSRAQVADTLAAAWDAAVVWASKRDRPDHTREAAQVRARKRAAALAAWCADPDSPADDAERAVLAYAAQTAHDKGSVSPAMPRRAIASTTGLSERQVRNVIARLIRRGLLIRTDPGRAADDKHADKRRAATYRLPDRATLDAARPIPVPGNPVCGPLSPGTYRSMGRSNSDALGRPDLEPVQVYGPPPETSEPVDPEPEQSPAPGPERVQVYGPLASGPERVQVYGPPTVERDSTLADPNVCPHGERHGNRPDLWGQRLRCTRCDLDAHPEPMEATG